MAPHPGAEQAQTERCVVGEKSIYSSRILPGILRGVALHLEKPQQWASASAYRMVGAQCVLLVAMVLTAWIWKGHLAAFSVFWGGAASLLPSAYFAKRVFKQVDARAARAIARHFFTGEAIKLLLNVVLVVLFVSLLPVSLLPFLVGFSGTQMGFWLAPFFDRSRNT